MEMTAQILCTCRVALRVRIGDECSSPPSARKFEGFSPARCSSRKPPTNMQPDGPLSRVLKSWQVTPQSSANFRTGVWQRIEAARRAGGESWSAYLRIHLAGWMLATVVITAGSGWVGFSAAKTKNETTRQKMVATYVASIDARAHVRP